MKKQNRASRKNSKFTATSQPKIRRSHLPKQILRCKYYDSPEVVEIWLDEHESELLKSAAKVTGLNYPDLLWFIINRQAKAFLPNRPEDFSCNEQQVLNITELMTSAKTSIDTVQAIVTDVCDNLKRLKQETLPASALVGELTYGLSLMRRLISSARVGIYDADTHWSTWAKPVLLERDLPVGRADSSL